MENIPVSFSVAQVPFAAAAAVPSSPFLGVDPGRSSANPWLAPAAPESATTHVSIHIGSIDARGQADPARFADEIYEALNERLGKGVLRDGRTTAGIITSL